MLSDNKKSRNISSSKKSNDRILYDARGVRVKNKSFANRTKKILLLYILPYLIINGIILAVVIAKPKIDLKVSETNDYRSTDVTFTIKSLLPIKELEVSMESAPIEFEKSSRSTYKAKLERNGTLYIEATALNGMREVAYADVNVLDDTAPHIDEESCKIAKGELSFNISDSQSGVNFDSIYGIYGEGKQVRPTKVDKKTGLVTIPMYTDNIEIHFEDMVGNARSGSISASADNGDIIDQEEDADASSETADTVKTADKPTESKAEKASEKSSEKASEKAADKSDKKPSAKDDKKTSEKSKDKKQEKPSKKAE